MRVEVSSRRLRELIIEALPDAGRGLGVSRLLDRVNELAGGLVWFDTSRITVREIRNALAQLDVSGQITIRHAPNGTIRRAKYLRTQRAAAA